MAQPLVIRLPWRVNNMHDLIARIGDIPYTSSPPMQFSLTLSAVLSNGNFEFFDVAGGTPLGRSELAGSKNITENSLIVIKDFSFAADIPILDYQQSLVAGTIPNFNLFLTSDAGAPQFKDPIQLPNYMDKQQYILALTPKVSENAFTGFYRGSFPQTAATAGLNTIDFTINFYAVEVVDDNYIAAFKKNYPEGYHNHGRHHR